MFLTNGYLAGLEHFHRAHIAPARRNDGYSAAPVQRFALTIQIGADKSIRRRALEKNIHKRKGRIPPREEVAAFGAPAKK